jgi:3-dehydroquinate dehydratase/shikimate dehydrogenase
MMLCVVIKGPTFEEAHQQISKALGFADLVELRLDYFKSLDLSALHNLRTHFSIPMIFALRSQIHGGNYSQSEENRLEEIRRLAKLKPEFLDLENHVLANFIEEITSQYPDIKLILSYHHFSETPKNLESLYSEMQKIPAFFYKIAITAKNSLDAMRLISLKKRSDNRLIAISMGLHGQISRILGPIVDSPITYAALEDDQTSAPGQLSAKTLIERYHHRSLNPRTAIYGLIGDPVDLSISDETHNTLMTACGLDSVYAKIQVNPAELSDFLQYAKQLPFHGLSVTMPFKEHILPLLDHIDAQALEIGAVNTLLFETGKVFGYNTDGFGALNAIEKECLVKSKRMVIIGAGGATKAIAYEAKRRGALVTIINRDAEKAYALAERLDCIGKGLDYMATCAEKGYDILINSTPVSLPIAPEYILPRTIVMDIKTKPKETAFLKVARDKDCKIIYGYRMFVEQALGQFSLWFKDFNPDERKSQLEKTALECIKSEYL